MTRFLFNVTTTSLPRRDSIFAALAGIDQQFRNCRTAASAARILDNAKPGLFALLQSRFEHPVAQALTVKILNLFMARFHLQARSVTLLSRPFGLVVDPSNLCQLACPGCVHSTRNEDLKVFEWPNGILMESRIAALLKIYGPSAIEGYLCNYGEPLLNLQTPRLIRLMKTYLMRTALSTSLSVRKFDAAAYVESGLDFMNISIDGATQPIYRIFRRNGDLDLVLHHLRNLVAAKRELRKNTPVLSWTFLAFEHNAHEIPLASRMARQLGVDEFRVATPFDVTWDDPEIRPAAVKAGLWRFSLLTRMAAAANWNPFPHTLDHAAIAAAFESPWSGPPEAAPAPGPGHACHWLYKNIVMDATGRILPCCSAPRPDANLVFDKFEAGAIDPFNSPKYHEARGWFSGSQPASATPPYCKHCDWDQTSVNIDAPQIRAYFRAAGPSVFDSRSLNLLANWRQT